VIPAVPPNERLRGNDRLVFVGIVDSMVDLQKIRGLVPATDQVFKLDSPRSQRCLIEAVASGECPVVGKTIRDGRFRSIYNAVVIAVGRQGERIKSKIGDIVLKAGDTLLLEAHPSFVNHHRNSRHFFLVSRLENSKPPRFEKAALALSIVLTMVVLVTIGETLSERKKIQESTAGASQAAAAPANASAATVEAPKRENIVISLLSRITMFKAALVAAALMIVTRCCSIDEARRSIEWQVLLAIAASFAIGLAIAKTGAADALTTKIIAAVGGSPWLSLVAIYAITLIVTEMITNNAAAALMFPFAISAAANLNANPMSFIITVMMAASAGFATPIGYQTNLMVYGPGGYRFGDYLRIGLPLDILVLCVTVTIAPLVWPF
jgi:di/tricarboxylate transporter